MSNRRVKDFMSRLKPGPAEAEAPEPQPDAPKTILIVEDDDHVRALLEFLLAREGYTVHAAPDGRAGLALIESLERPSLVLLDLMLPFAGGFELLTKIRQQASWAGVPVVMLTTVSNEREVVRALDLGANDYVNKPFQPVELMARVRRHLESGS